MSKVISDEIKKAVFEAAKKAGLKVQLGDVTLEHPVVDEHGDYSTNIALRLATPAKKIADLLPQNPNWTANTSGQFINFTLSPKWLVGRLEAVDQTFGENELLKGKKIVVEFTDPNPFKELHVGHVYSNSVGEAISRLLELEGGLVRRVTYQGDVGLHVAKSIWGIRETISKIPSESAKLE